jgi:hypothetical protein
MSRKGDFKHTPPPEPPPPSVEEIAWVSLVADAVLNRQPPWDTVTAPNGKPPFEQIKKMVEAIVENPVEGPESTFQRCWKVAHPEKPKRQGEPTPMCAFSTKERRSHTMFHAIVRALTKEV